MSQNDIKERVQTNPNESNKEIANVEKEGNDIPTVDIEKYLV